MMVAIDHLRELASKCRVVRVMCPCNPAYEKAKVRLHQAEQAAFDYLLSLDMAERPATLPVADHYFDGDTGKGGGI